jgi:cytochrome c oxidase subunit III
MSSSITREMPPASTLPRAGSGPREPGWWGMLLFCVTEAALFLYFLGGYFYLRGTVHAFAAEEGKFASLTVPVVLTTLLVTSSFTLRWGEQGIRRGDRRRLTVGLVATIVLGLSFLALQSMEYARQPHVPQSDAYWSAFYTITGFHGMHVVLGLLILGFNLLRTVKGHFTGDRHLAVENGSLYWHTVDIVWIGVVSSLYFAPRLW